MRAPGHTLGAAVSLDLPRRFLRGSSTTLALTVAAIACGVALVCALDIASRGVLRAFVEVVDTMAGRAALQVMSGDGGLVPEDVATTVATVPGVTMALGVVMATATIGEGPDRESLAVHATDLTSDAGADVYGMKSVALGDPLDLLAHQDSI